MVSHLQRIGGGGFGGSVSSAQSAADGFGVLPEIHHSRDNDSPPLNHVENSIRETMDEHPPISLVEWRRNLSETPNPPKRRIEMTHEHPATARLTRFVKLVRGLNVGVGGKKKDQLTHSWGVLPRMRC